MRFILYYVSGKNQTIWPLQFKHSPRGPLKWQGAVHIDSAEKRSEISEGHNQAGYILQYGKFFLLLCIGSECFP